MRVLLSTSSLLQSMLMVTIVRNVDVSIRVKVDHSVTYSLGDGKHPNGIESFWAIVKRGVYGVYHHISVEHMQKYMDEFCLRHHHRVCDDAFESLVSLAITA